MSIAEQAVVADAMEAARQHVQQEAPHELVGLERHGFVARTALLAVVLPAEGDAALIEGEEPAVGDGHPMGIAGEVPEDRGGPCEGALGVDDPLELPQRYQPLVPHLATYETEERSPKNSG